VPALLRALSIAVIAALPVPADAGPVSVTMTARSIRPGELVVLTIAGAEGAVTVRAFDRDWRAFADAAGASRVPIGIDLSVEPGRYPVEIVAGQDRTTRELVVLPRRFPTRRLTVDPDLVNPPADALERIERERRELERAWEQSSDTRLWHGPFVRPVAHHANSAFGTRSFYNGQARTPHGGADFASPEGTRVKSPNAGRVVLAGSRYFTGGTVVIDHGLGVFSLFAHLSRIDVTPGEDVKAGMVVGSVGATGRVTGPHLHWAVRVNGARVDPLSLLSVLGVHSPPARPIRSRHP
jgi:murein DD-endopeptidase MepM/ murein hydrolase activator NlpD